MSGGLFAIVLGGGAAGSSSSLSVSVSPPSASGGAPFGGSVPSVTAIGAGGSGYTYAWTLVTPDPVYSLTINTPAVATTSFDFGAVGPGESANATVRVTVTSGAFTAFVDVNVYFLSSRQPPITP